MKNMKTLLNILRVQPEFEKLTTFELLKKLTNALPVGLKKGVKFAYIKNNTIIFALLHSLYKREFIYAENTIKFLIKNLPFEIEINSISTFVLNEVTFIKKEEVEKPIFYKERAFGVFTNNIKDKKLYTAFERIRLDIQKNRENQEEEKN